MKRVFHSFFTSASVALVLFASLGFASSASARGAVIFAEGEAAPIVLALDVTPTTERVAEELADFMAAMTGVRPLIVKGQPDPLPATAIWVGYQPVIDTLFPGVDFSFNHPEEILLVANDRHVAITGRDRWNPATAPLRARGWLGTPPQQEYGTANAIFTFLQDNLGVRWFWPGDHGWSVIETDRIVIEPFIFRYHPQIRSVTPSF